VVSPQPGSFWPRLMGGDCEDAARRDSAVLVTNGEDGFAFVEAQQTEMLTGPLAAGSATVLASSHGEPVMLVTGYQQARLLLTDARLSRAAATGHGLIGPASAMSVTEMDPPRHSMVRGLVGRAFSARSLERLVPRIHRRAIGLVTDIREAGPPVDLVVAFCAPFAFDVHCDVLGVPEEFRAAIRRRSLARSGQPGATAQQVYDAEICLHQVVVESLGHMRCRGGTGLWGELLATRDRGELTEAELTGLASSLLFDGHILAAAQIALAALCLLRHRDQATLLAVTPSRLAHAIEETLRFSPSITLGMPRKARINIDLDGLRVPSGHAIAIAFGLTNRDPTVFHTPHRLDLTRAPNRHLSFGRGTHHCLGGHVMRLELRIALEVLIRYLPHLDLAVDNTQLGWTASHTVRSLRTLPLTWSTRH
jgi:cytochrome P450